MYLYLDAPETMLLLEMLANEMKQSFDNSGYQSKVQALYDRLLATDLTVKLLPVFEQELPELEKSFQVNIFVQRLAGRLFDRPEPSQREQIFTSLFERLQALKGEQK